MSRQDSKAINESSIKIVHQKFDTITTTQEKIKEFKDQISTTNWIVCTAEEQTSGKGTHNRRWASPPHVNVYATYGLQIEGDKITLLSFLPQIVAYSVAQTLLEFEVKNVAVKWVNDVLVDGKKICGILAESDFCGGTDLRGNPRPISIYLGIGVNVNMSQEICDSLDQPVTSMAVSAGKFYDKEKVLHALSQHLKTNIMKLVNLGFDHFQNGISKLLAFKNQTIWFDTEDQKATPKIFEAEILGIDTKGGLVLRPKLSDSGSNTLTFITGRILRGKEVEEYLKLNQKTALTPSKLTTSKPEIKSPKPEVKSSSFAHRVIKHKWPIAATLSMVTAGLFIWSKTRPVAPKSATATKPLTFSQSSG